MLRILHLEDDPTDALFVRQTLELNGVSADVLHARNAKEYTTAIEHGGFDVILVDNGLPGFSGKAALEMARTQCPEVPFIFVSGAEDETQAVAGLKAGASDFVSKDKLWRLVAAIKRLNKPATSIKTDGDHEKHDGATRRLIEELRQQVQNRTLQLEMANRESEAFSYSISHDLRAPLRHVLGYLNMLQESAAKKLNETELRHMSHVASAAQRMTRLIDDLLAFSRLSRVELRKMAVDMDQLVQTVVSQLQPETKDRNITWKVSPLPEATGDANLLRQVWSNLVANAIKYSRPRDPAIIEIGSKDQDGQTVYFVCDNGVGFEMEHSDKLFGVFKRLHAESEFEGTGIGLANVRAIIQRHGGLVWGEGEVDKGSTFYFSLPKTAPVA